MAVLTTTGHVSRAIDFYNKQSLYFALGHSSPWEDENQPEAVAPDTKFIEPIGYKQVYEKYLVYPSASGAINYKNQSWRIVGYDEALALGAKWVYLSAVIEYEELPLITYRQIGIYSGLVKVSSVPEGKTNLLPSEVVNPGILEIIDNRKPTYRELDRREMISLIIEF